MVAYLLRVSDITSYTDKDLKSELNCHAFCVGKKVHENTVFSSHVTTCTVHTNWIVLLDYTSLT